MNAVILCVGKLKEKWAQDGVDEYLKRLSRYGKYSIEAVKDEPDPAGDSDALIEKVKEKEGRQLLAHIRDNDHVICLAINGREMDSPGLSRRMNEWSLSGKRVVLVIGGSNGLSPEVLARGNEFVSFSRLTFPHGLMRVVLLEQLYRGEKIMANEKYHK